MHFVLTVRTNWEIQIVLCDQSVLPFHYFLSNTNSVSSDFISTSKVPMQISHKVSSLAQICMESDENNLVLMMIPTNHCFEMSCLVGSYCT